MNDATRFFFAYDAELPLETRRDQGAEEDEALERVSFLSSGPSRVPALLARPPVATRGGILIQHGGGESKDDPLIRLLMRRWSEAGFACLAIDAPHHGARALEGVTTRRRAFYEYVRTRIQNVIDLRRAIDFLVDEEGVDAGRIGYWGVSMGGSVGVMLMAVDARVRAGCFCLAGARPRRTWPDLEPDMAEFAARNLDPPALAPLTAGRPALMLNGDHDPTIPKADAVRLFEALGEPKEQRWFAAGHKVTAAMLRASKEFFEGALA